MPGLASHALGVKDLTSDPGGSGFCRAIRNAHTRLWAHRKGNEVVFEGEGVMEGQGRQPRAPGNSDMTLVKPTGEVRLWVTICTEEKGCACFHSSPNGGFRRGRDPRPTPSTPNSATVSGPGTQLGQEAHQGPHSPSRTASRARGMP